MRWWWGWWLARLFFSPQHGMTAPPKGFEGNFTAAGSPSTFKPPPRPHTHHHRPLRPPPPLSYQTLEQRREGWGVWGGRRQRSRVRATDIILSTSLLLSARVLMIHFPPDMRKLLAQRKKAVNQCY